MYKGKILINRMKDEKGSQTIEFIGLLPIMFLILALFYQILITVYSVNLVQSAANEAAKIYSTTGDKVIAENAAGKIIRTNDSLELVGLDFPMAGKLFTAKINVKYHIKYLPDSFSDKFSPLLINYEAHSRVIE